MFFIELFLFKTIPLLLFLAKFENSDIVDWLSGCKYGFMPYLQNNWKLHVTKERTIGTRMNTDEHGLKRKFVSPSATKDT
jgi:hypothetical protein